MKTPIFTTARSLLLGLGLASSAIAQTTTDATTTSGSTTSGTTTSGTTTSGTTSTQGTGVFVYELKFKHVDGFNVDFWGGGYVIVPATGGVGSAILTAIDDGIKEYTAASGSVAFYFAKSRDKRYSVVAMGNGTPGGNAAVLSMQAYGESNHSISVETDVATLKVKAAKTMKGFAQASQDESSVSSLSTDGTVGFVEFSEMKLEIDEEMTNRINEDYNANVSDGFTELENEIKRRGYVARSTGTTTSGTTTSGTTTSGTTTSGTTTGGPSGGTDGTGAGS